METAKLLVAAGAPLQLRAGETLLPVQPKPLNTWSLAIVAPSLISGLVSARLCALAPPPPSRPRASVAISAAIQTADFAMSFHPWAYRYDGGSLAASRFWSGRRESNPRMQLGKLPFCH